MITFSNVTKRYGDTLAADGLSFTVREGQVLGLLGQNGAGKTTALSMLTGYLAPTEGAITIGGHDLLREPRAAWCSCCTASASTPAATASSSPI